MSAAYKQRQGKGLHLPGRQRAARLLLLESLFVVMVTIVTELVVCAGGRAGGYLRERYFSSGR